MRFSFIPTRLSLSPRLSTVDSHVVIDDIATSDQAIWTTEKKQRIRRLDRGIKPSLQNKVVHCQSSLLHSFRFEDWSLFDLKRVFYFCPGFSLYNSSLLNVFSRCLQEQNQQLFIDLLECILCLCRNG